MAPSLVLCLNSAQALVQHKVPNYRKGAQDQASDQAKTEQAGDIHDPEVSQEQLQRRGYDLTCKQSAGHHGRRHSCISSRRANRQGFHLERRGDQSHLQAADHAGNDHHGGVIRKEQNAETTAGDQATQGKRKAAQRLGEGGEGKSQQERHQRLYG